MSYCLSLLTVKTLLVQVVLHPTLFTVTILPVLLLHHPQAIPCAKHPPSCSDTSAVNESTAPCTSRSVVSPIFIDDDDDFPALCKNGASDPAEDITRMIEMFLNMTEEQLRYLYDLSKHSFTCAVDCALAGPSLETL